MKLSTRLLILAAGGSYKKVKDPLPYAIAVGHILGLPPGNVPKDVQKRLDSIGHDAVDMPGLPDKVEVYVRAPVAADSAAYERKLTNPDHMPLHPPQEQALIRATVHGTTHDFYLLGNDVSHLDAFEETHFPVWPPRTQTQEEDTKESLLGWLPDFQKNKLQHTTLWADGGRKAVSLVVGVPHTIENSGDDTSLEKSLEETLQGMFGRLAEVRNEGNGEFKIRIRTQVFKEHKEDILAALLAFDEQMAAIPPTSPNGASHQKALRSLRQALDLYSDRLHVFGLFGTDYGLNVDLSYSYPVGYATAYSDVVDRMGGSLSDFIKEATGGLLKYRRTEDLSGDDDKLDFRLYFRAKKLSSPEKNLATFDKMLSDPGKSSTFVSLIESAFDSGKEMSE